MASISTYAIDQILSIRDKVIGTDVAGTVTKNYELGDIISFFNKKGLVETLASSFEYAGQPASSSARVDGTISFDPPTASSVSFSSITSLLITSKDLADADLSSYYTKLIGSRILIQKSGDPSKFGIYNLTASTSSSKFSNVHDISLTHVFGNSSLENESNYLISLLQYDYLAATDKHFEFTQASPSITWTVNHDLNKFPSVTVVDSAGTQVFGDVDHTDNDNLTITFINQFSGKAYLN
tara:strand:+ start:270 stop:986 length:717 start_codon:yes stop_codon:yes gene_type:complete